jgi:hypothetical protein
MMFDKKDYLSFIPVVAAALVLYLLEMLHVAWPKGKYNGQMIQGFRLSLQIHVLSWRFIPVFNWYFGEPYLIWLCFTLRAKAEYKARSAWIT